MRLPTQYCKDFEDALRMIEKPDGVIDMNSAVVRHEKLGGALNYYDRRAA